MGFENVYMDNIQLIIALEYILTNTIGFRCICDIVLIKSKIYH
jgi:hypothetical protein